MIINLKKNKSYEEIDTSFSPFIFLLGPIALINMKRSKQFRKYILNAIISWVFFIICLVLLPNDDSIQMNLFYIIFILVPIIQNIYFSLNSGTIEVIKLKEEGWIEVNIDEEKYEILYKKGVYLLNSNQNSDALNIFLDLIKKKYSQGYLGAGLAYINNKDYEMAKKYFNFYLKYDSNIANKYLNNIKTLEKKEVYDSKRKESDKLYSENTKLYEEAINLLNSNRVNEALNIFLNLIKKEYNKGYLGISLVYIQNKDYKSAKKYLSVYSKYDKHTANQYLDKINTFEKKKLEEDRIYKENQKKLEKINFEKIKKEELRIKEESHYKKDWKAFKEILDKHNITKLYHFTDRTNLESIINNNGLYSWKASLNKGIIVNRYGGGELSRSLDENYSLENYVRLSFTQNHPMMFVARNSGRISDPVILEIDPKVIFYKDTLFSDMNATKTGHSSGSDLKSFEKIHFDIVKEPNQFDIEENYKKYYQAEVMIKEHLELKDILNIHDIDLFDSFSLI